MSKKTEYEAVTIPGLGRVRIPKTMNPEDVFKLLSEQNQD